MPHEIQLHALGGPENLTAADTAARPLLPGEIRLQHTVIGFNYLDVYLRRGVYQVPLPTVLGVEGVGVITELAPDITGLHLGQRIAYTNELGAYADERILSADRAIPLPDDISDDAAAALLFKGQTVHMLLTKVYPVGPGSRILVHSAAGGIGLSLTRWAKSLGATVIGTVGHSDKTALALANGADHVVVRGASPVSGQIRDLTGGLGVDVVYDAIGRDSFTDSLSALRPFGVMASYGQASGEIPAIEPRPLSRYGSVFFIRANVDHHLAAVSDYQQAAAAVLDRIRSGVLTPNIGLRLPLGDVALAHQLAENRNTQGATLLYPTPA